MFGLVKLALIEVTLSFPMKSRAYTSVLSVFEVVGIDCGLYENALFPFKLNVKLSV